MKDYSYSFDIPRKYKEEKEEYFLYYEKEDGKIYVYLSNGGVKEFTDSVEIENKIIERMEAQVLKYADDFIDYYKEESDEIIKRTSPVFLVSGVSSAFIYDSPLVFNVLNFSVLGLSSLAIGYGGLGHLYSNILKKDFDKHKLFLDNKELIQSGSYRDLRPLNGINKKAMLEVKSNLAKDQASININTVRLLKKNELERIIENIKCNNKTYSLSRE